METVLLRNSFRVRNAEFPDNEDHIVIHIIDLISMHLHADDVCTYLCMLSIFGC